jgi:transcriptional regulator GlxA family with amidase domain
VIFGEPLYKMHVVSVAGGKLRNSFGMTVETERAEDILLDTLLVGGAPDNSKPAADMIDFLRRAPTRIRRIAAICGAAFILGEAELLDGRRATTHWRLGKKLQEAFPAASVEVDRIFIADGPIWTSAGMTAGIDLALSLVEHDLGREKARMVARMMVVHHRRAGGQSQHSALLEMDAKSDRVQDALAYARRNLGKALTVEDLAEAACLSPRQFSRIFRKETGLSPAKAIENLRLEAARLMLEQSRLPLGTVAEQVGFGDRERMRRSFQRSFGQNPQSVRNTAQPLAAL